ncbi:MAG: hypothetical protein OXH84_07480 [Gammaproteobacteria bacterium]|nr:hypothetical protein [Gammaproteobacteria bacterium]
MKKTNSTIYAIFKNRKELEIARVAYLLVIAITMSAMLFVVGKLNFVDALLFAPSAFAALYIASFVIFARKRVHLEEEDGPRRIACNDN